MIPLAMMAAACWTGDVQAQCSGGRGGGPTGGGIATVSPRGGVPLDAVAAIQTVAAQRQLYEMQLAQLQQKQMLAMQQRTYEQDAYRERQHSQIEWEQSLLAQRQERAERLRQKRADRLAARIAERRSVMLTAKVEEAESDDDNPFASTY
ncbi:hypothetical protein [Novipirellula caenicola]|uniref:hypothetical protein n=1 Tax=Novipirellula caenicola TaxID=1536901 RepID=UPI0031EF73F9